MIEAGTPIQRVVDVHPTGTTYVLGAGTHRLQQVIPKDGDHFIGAPGARLNGARQLNGATRNQGRFLFLGIEPNREALVRGVCRPEFPACDQPMALFLDDEPLRRVQQIRDVVPGTWQYDRSSRTLTLADNPDGRRLELAETPFAFGGRARSVTIQNLVVEKYASANQAGAINDEGAGRGWSILNNETSRNYGYGINVGGGGRAIGNRAVFNGQLGIGGGTASGMLVEANEIAFNAWNGVDCAWECGGAKFGAVRDLIIRDNYVHHNGGNGLWTDDRCANVLFEGNRVERNARGGIVHEISFSALIRRNNVSGNGLEGSVWGWNAGIQVQNSGGVRVEDNRVELDPVHGGNGIILLHQDRTREHPLRDVLVARNTVVMRGGDGTVAGWYADFEPEAVPRANIRFAANHYSVFSLAPANDAWANNAPGSFSAWQAAGFDQDGTASTALP